MTDTNTGWPGKPGVPLNPEKGGWHWVRRVENNMPFPLQWTNDWTGSRDYCWAIMGSGEPEDVAKNFCYLGPCLTPDEATALQSRVAELEAERIIKPLVWEETLADRGDGTWEHDGGYESVTPFGVYAIYFDYLKGMWLVYGLDGGSLADPLNSPSTAKLTAEADYDARITAALEGKKDE